MRGAAAANFSRAERLVGLFFGVRGDGGWDVCSWVGRGLCFSLLSLRCFFEAVGSFPDFFNVPRVGEGVSIG